MKIKSQKGSITIFVLIALLFYTAFLLLMYAANTNKFKTITEKSDILKGIYEKNTSEESINNIYNKKNTEQLIAGIEKISLPAEYQQVEYLESTGTQYIDTGVYLPYKADFDIYYKNKKSNTVGNVGFGYYNDNGFTFEEQSWNASNAKNILIFDTNWSDGYSFPNSFFNTIRHIELIGNNLYIDEELYSTYERIGDNVASNSLLLGAYRANNCIKYNSGIIMGKMKFLYNNEVLFNGIPCYRKSDNKPGLFDLVKNKFYTNQGTGEFTVGPDVD